MTFLLGLLLVGILIETRLTTPRLGVYGFIGQSLLVFWTCVFFALQEGVESVSMAPWMMMFFGMLCLLPLSLLYLRVRKDSDEEGVVSFNPNRMLVGVGLSMAAAYVVMDLLNPFAPGRDYVAAGIGLFYFGLRLLAMSRTLTVRMVGLASAVNGFFLTGYFLAGGTFSVFLFCFAMDVVAAVLIGVMAAANMESRA